MFPNSGFRKIKPAGTYFETYGLLEVTINGMLSFRRLEYLSHS
jgi:hypothetical protein